jgi:hypothetical protein
VFETGKNCRMHPIVHGSHVVDESVDDLDVFGARVGE